MVADLIEHLRDYKYHIKSLEIAENVVRLLDDITGKEYAQKFKDQIKDYKGFSGKV
jgi:hypothetical protein